MARPSVKTRCNNQWTELIESVHKLSGISFVGQPYVCKRFGYYFTRVCRYGKVRPYRLHKLVWEIYNGPTPDGVQIDHKYGDKTDFDISNLRLATNQQNSSNRIVEDMSNIDCRCGGYRVRVSYFGKTYYFGTYKDLELAQLVRDEVRSKFNGEFCGRYCG